MSNLRTKKDVAWIGVDFDGTLVNYKTAKTHQHNLFGEPVWPMVERIKKWIKDGITVKIVTARVGAQKGTPEDIELVRKLIQGYLVNVCGLPELEVIDRKDYNMVILVDDRAVGVLTNTGDICEHCAERWKNKVPYLEKQ